jgi:hypothetical protein
MGKRSEDTGPRSNAEMIEYIKTIGLQIKWAKYRQDILNDRYEYDRLVGLSYLAPKYKRNGKRRKPALRDLNKAAYLLLVLPATV